MKNLFKYAMLFVAMVIGTTCLTACGGDDEDGGGNTIISTSQLLGTWTVSNYDGTTYQFLNKGVFKATSNTEGTMTGTWSMANNIITVLINKQTATMTVVSYKDGILTISSNGQTIKLTKESSDEDDDTEYSGSILSLKNTSWTVLSNNDDEEMVGVKVTFKSNNDVVFSPDNTDWKYIKWTQEGSKLTIVVGEETADDYMEGTVTISGNVATYTYSWYDYETGNKQSNRTYTMTLKKQ